MSMNNINNFLIFTKIENPSDLAKEAARDILERKIGNNPSVFGDEMRMAEVQKYLKDFLRLHEIDIYDRAQEIFKADAKMRANQSPNERLNAIKRKIKNEIKEIAYAAATYDIVDEISDTFAMAGWVWKQNLERYPFLNNYSFEDEERKYLCKFISYLKGLKLIVKRFEKSGLFSKDLLLNTAAILEGSGKVYTNGSELGKNTIVRKNLVIEICECNFTPRPRSNKRNLETVSDQKSKVQKLN